MTDQTRDTDTNRPPAWSLGGVFEFATRVTPRQLLLLFVAFNLAFLAFDVYLAHGLMRRYFKVAYEWIPIYAAPPAALIAALLAFRPRPGRFLMGIHLLAMALMLVVGLIGFAMHLFAALGLSGRLTWEGIVYAAPMLAPLAFGGVALVGIVAAAEEDPDQPGRLCLLGGWLRAPFSQQQHLHLLNGLGLLITTLLAVIDHSPVRHEQPIVWIPTVGGFFLAGLTLHHAALSQPRRSENVVYFWAMLGAIALGLFGFAMHMQHALAGTGQLTWERLIDAVPFAPLLFCNMGLLGLLAMIEPAGTGDESSPEEVELSTV
jgi:hypothetical protein